MSKILINTMSLSCGGGQKVAWNILRKILERINSGTDANTYCFLCNADSDLCKMLKERNAENIYAVRVHNPVMRILWEIFCANKLFNRIKPDIIYSIFGYPIFSRKFLSVIGEADSNLFYPEINFWQHITGISLLKRHLVDRFRIKMMFRADGIIFENEAIFRRVPQIFPRLSAQICFIQPAIEKKISNAEPLLPDPKSPDIRLLLLCSWQLNKNIMILPQILAEIKRKGYTPHLFFSVNADDTNPVAKEFYGEAAKYAVEENISYLGTVPPSQLETVYNKTEQILLLSQLESFSNNIIEAWCYQKALVISDLEWSRSIVGDSAAVFVDRDNVHSIADAIIHLHTDPEYYRKTVTAGKEKLLSYPDASNQVDQILSFLMRVMEKKRSKEK